MGLCRFFAACATLFVASRSVLAVQIRTQSDTSEGEAVCISMAVYESAPWVDLMIANVAKFSEPTTKIALHLDAASKFTPEDIARWETDRVTVSPERVKVMPFQGSILYAHLLNAQSMSRKWGSECKFFVLQASNMMWVRAGMEQQVRTRRFSPLASHTYGHGCAEWDKGNATYLQFTRRLGAPKQLYGWGQPEGSFFPFEDVLKCSNMLNTWLGEIKADSDVIVGAKCYFENTWLQTYMLNYATLPENASLYDRRLYHPLSLNSIAYGDKPHDVVPWEKLQQVMAGSEGYDGYYAVKRVNRDLEHPTTKYIAKLSEWRR